MYNQMTNGSSSQQPLQQLTQQIIAIPAVQPSYGGHSMTLNGTNARIINSQEDHGVRILSATTASETIDLSSQSSSRVPSPM